MADVISVVEGLDFAVSLASGHVHPEEVYAARTVAEGARTRSGHLGSTLVLALVGGTGTGKSSLLNALAGAPVASTSPVRPHTTEPLAWIPAGAEPSLGILLDRLGVAERVTQEAYPELAVLDMTDIDSVTTAHRDQVERLLPEVDLILWVLDPVKYADPVLHREFIAPLAESSDRLVFVLNQIDRLDDPTLLRIHTDLHHLLSIDGVRRPTIFPVAADPPRGEPRGIEPLAAHLGERLDQKRIQIGRIVDDARRAARSIAGAAGITAGGSLEFEQRWRQVRAAIVSETLAAGDGSGFEESLRILEAMVLRLATEAGGGFGLRIRQGFRPEQIEAELREAVDASWHSDDPATILDAELQERFGAPIRKVLWERASLSAVLAGLAVDAATIDGGLGRNEP
jgi:energy-coupling factor transporter ATP-binding protein EcfA2